ncbi:hypothetical protein MASSI9I_60365 [Massilia sp. 9I]|nr:hypothetical protein MASSI9I_60365 [Massilia sp. 9I]
MVPSGALRGGRALPPVPFDGLYALPANVGQSGPLER